MTEPADLPATALLAAYRDGSLSPVEVARSVIARIEAWEPGLGATYLFRPEPALAAAAESEARWRRGEARALDGVPVTIKENIATAGDPMPLGTAGREPPITPADAPAAARMREAGTVLVAKTTMPDYGMLSSGLSSFHRLARNPWDLSKTPGGSSAGAGGAAAAGFGPLHLGTDIGGSVRLPGTWSGVVALKPSFGRVPVDPPYWGRAVGPMTRTVADAALMMRELAKADPRDGMSLPPSELDYSAPPLAIRGLRIGYLPDAGVGLPVDPEVAAAVAKAARLFEAEGAIVETIPPFLTRAMLDGLDVFWRQRSFADIDALPPEGKARVLSYIRAWVEPARHYDGLTVYRGLSQLHVIRDATLAATRDYDFVISPVASGTAFPAELGTPNHEPERPFEHIAFTVPYNFSEQPAISVPAAMSPAGLPIGLQIAGRRFDDAGVLRLAAAFEALRDPLPAWPVPPQA
ncbi:amidase [Enterovirga rhinocerotis]|uniref:Aspartyl-tRNA(Asn)/glutamyl-tRNA(Gln) amidotransferase subunit A n=1 Tax=Enterovirga rhinocerotis TaxID=1339210 RepID=A0A4V3DZ01_9HYPH|nr:amidase [Enterovirga rhinocerotis]TDR94589.1 aspartyl-tRNA(Asn)/glutamyl-tRNA(Gln) amidotransferase subunit A [Enterovirga rhinocerotis]